VIQDLNRDAILSTK